MWRGWVFSVILFFRFASCAISETVIDVSKEWNAHASSSPVAESDRMPVQVKPSTAAEEPGCKCEPMTVEERLDDSTYAFTGFVASASAAKKGKRTIAFDVDEIFKGTPKEEMKATVDVTGDGCDLPFEEGQSYLVYAKWEWGNVITSSCMGTKLLVKAKNELGPSQELKNKLYIHLRNACMGRIDTTCCLASLKAMRAGYYVPEPEEGCPSGTVPDRLHCSGSYTWCIPLSEKTHQ